MSHEALQEAQRAKVDVYADWTRGALAKRAVKEEVEKPPVLLKSFQDIVSLASKGAKSITVELAILHDPRTTDPMEGTKVTVDCETEKFVYSEAYTCYGPDLSISALLRRDNRVKILKENSDDNVKIIYEGDKTPDAIWQKMYAYHHENSILMAEVFPPIKTQETFPLKTVKRLPKPTALPA